MYVFECVIWDSQHTQTLVSLWGLRDVDGELAAERVNSPHARVTAEPDSEGNWLWLRGTLYSASVRSAARFKIISWPIQSTQREREKMLKWCTVVLIRIWFKILHYSNENNKALK